MTVSYIIQGEGAGGKEEKQGKKRVTAGGGKSNSGVWERGWTGGGRAVERETGGRGYRYKKWRCAAEVSGTVPLYYKGKDSDDTRVEIADGTGG